MAIKEVYQWNIDQTNIALQEQGGAYFLKTEADRFPIELGNASSVQESIDYIQKNCLPVLKEGIPHLAKSLKSWYFQDRTIRLLKSGESLFWHLFYPSALKGWNYPIVLDKDQTIKEFVKTTILAPQFPQDLIKAIICKSEFDETVSFDLNRWTVTIINCGPTFEGHAVIAIEGVNESGPFLRYVHITGNSKILVGKANVINTGNTQHRHRVRGKSPTWVRTKDKVERLIKRVELEEKMQAGPTPIVHFNMSVSLIGTTPGKIGEFDSMDKLADFIKPLVREGLFPNDLYFMQQRLGDQKYYEYWIGERKSMFARLNVETGKDVSLIDKKIELYSYPDNCLSYAVRKLYFASIHIEYGFLTNVSTPAEFVAEELRAQEKCVIPLWIEGQSRVVRFDFTDDIQAKVKKAWKLSEGAVAMIDRWRWYPDVGTGFLSLRTLHQREGRDRMITTCLDSNKMKNFTVDVNTLHFNGLQNSYLSTLISVEEVWNEEKKLSVVVETKDGSQEVDLGDACFMKFVELGMSHKLLENTIATVAPEMGVQGRSCSIM